MAGQNNAHVPRNRKNDVGTHQSLLELENEVCVRGIALSATNKDSLKFQKFGHPKICCNHPKI